MKQPATSQHSQYAIRPWRGKPTLLRDGQPLPAVTYSYTFDVNETSGYVFLMFLP